MALKPPPIRDLNLPKTLLEWFQSIARESNAGYTGTFEDGNGNTVSVENGKITGIS